MESLYLILSSGQISACKVIADWLSDFFVIYMMHLCIDLRQTEVQGVAFQQLALQLKVHRSRKSVWIFILLYCDWFRKEKLCDRLVAVVVVMWFADI